MMLLFAILSVWGIFNHYLIEFFYVLLLAQNTVKSKND